MIIRIRGASARSALRTIRLVERLTITAGICLLAWPAFVAVDSAWAQWSGERELAKATKLSKETIVQGKVSKSARRVGPKAGSVVGKFQVPRLNLSYIILEGTADRTLDKSIGHVEGTALMGETGNIGIAGHRNTHFRKLEWIRRGDEVIVSSANGEYRYLVEWIRLFTPGDIEVLHPEHGPAVTLVTCFPFEYVGSAPLRYIVRALPDEETRARLNSVSTAGAEKPAEE